MKKCIALFLAMILAFGLVACGSTEAPAEETVSSGETVAEETPAAEEEAPVEEETPVEEAPAEEPAPEFVTVKAVNGASEEIEVEVPYDPQSIVTLDAASLDMLANLGLADRVVGCTTPEAYLEEYVPNAANVGSAKTFDVEAIMELQPDVIFMAGRGSDYYDTLLEIAPVVRLTVSGAVVEGTYANAVKIASIFGLEEEMEAKLGAYDERIAAIQALSEGKTAIVGMCTGGSFNLLGNDGRCSIIGNELGFENIGVDADVDTSTHGNEASFEFVVQAAPDYIFVLDRDKATNADGAQLAKDIMENELVMGTEAYQNGNLIIMENAGVWYKAEGGFTALGIMLADLEAALGLN